MIYAQYLQRFVVYLQRQETQKVNRSIELQLGEVNGSDEEGLKRDLFTYLEFLREMHVVQAVIFLVIMAKWAGATSGQTNDKHYLNYGYIMKNVGVTHVSNAKALISLAADLPTRNISVIDRSVCRGLRDRCEKVMSLAYAYRQLHNRAIQKLRDTLNYVYELLDFEETTRSKRSWSPGWMTQLLSQVTGLADQRDLAVL
jgi:hypothetical protein